MVGIEKAGPRRPNPVIHATLACWLCGYMLATPTRGFDGGAAAALPPQVEAGAEKLVRVLDPISVEYLRKRHSSMPYADLVKRLGISESEHALLELERIAFSYQTGKFRCRIESRASVLDDNLRFRKIETRVGVFTFDGVKFYNWSGENPSNWILSTDTGADLAAKAPKSPFLIADYFGPIGIRMPCRLGELLDGCKSWPVAILRKGGVLDAVKAPTADRKLWVVAVNDHGRRRTWRIRPDLGFAAAEYDEDDEAGRPITRTVADDFRSIPNDKKIQLPWRLTVSYYQYEYGLSFPSRGPSRDPLFTETFEIQSLNQSRLDDSFFRIVETRPGAIISDSTLPEAQTLPRKRVEYVIPADPAMLDNVIELAKGRSASMGARPGRLWRVLVIVNVVAVVVIAAFFWFVRPRRG